MSGIGELLLIGYPSQKILDEMLLLLDLDQKRIVAISGV
jgi:hypothetical protein